MGLLPMIGIQTYISFIACNLLLIIVHEVAYVQLDAALVVSLSPAEYSNLKDLGHLFRMLANIVSGFCVPAAYLNPVFYENPKLWFCVYGGTLLIIPSCALYSIIRRHASMMLPRHKRTTGRLDFLLGFLRKPWHIWEREYNSKQSKRRDGYLRELYMERQTLRLREDLNETRSQLDSLNGAMEEGKHKVELEEEEDEDEGKEEKEAAIEEDDSDDSVEEPAYASHIFSDCDSDSSSEMLIVG